MGTQRNVITVVKLPDTPEQIEADMRRNFARELDIEANVQLLQRNRITKTWKNETYDPATKMVKKERTSFIKVISKRKNRTSMSIVLGGSTMGKNKYIWLSFGTKVRYAHMTNKFKAKTRIGFIGSTKGRGGFSHMGRPLPGIDAREWDETIAKKRNPGLTRRLKQAGANALRGTIQL